MPLLMDYQYTLSFHTLDVLLSDYIREEVSVCTLLDLGRHVSVEFICSKTALRLKESNKWINKIDNMKVYTYRQSWKRESPDVSDLYKRWPNEHTVAHLDP